MADIRNYFTSFNVHAKTCLDNPSFHRKGAKSSFLQLPVKNKETPNKKSTCNYTRLKTALIGISIFSAIIGGLFISNSQERPKTSLLPIPPLNQSLDSTGTLIPLCRSPELWPDYEQSITKTVLACHSARELGIKANETSLSNGNPPWRIKIVDQNAIPFEAEAGIDQGEVRIRCGTTEAVSYAVFELTNLFQQGRTIEALDQALVGVIGTKAEWVRRMEKIEYDGIQLHNSVLDSCTNQLGWRQGVYLWPKESWDTYWKRLESGPHAQWHATFWDDQIENSITRKFNLLLK